MNLDKFVCKDNYVNGVKFSARIIESAKGYTNTRTLKKLRKINYIVVHNTGNNSSTAGAEMHARYIKNLADEGQLLVSWHLTVDCEQAIQHIPFDEVAYHAGDGNGNGNQEGIGIEIAENTNYPLSEQNGIKIICALMKQFNIPIERVQPHRFFASNKKLCPHLILKNQENWESNWKIFSARIAVQYKALEGGSPVPEPPVKPAECVEFAVGQGVAIKEGAVYGGLASTRGKVVPTEQFCKKHTIAGFAVHNGEKEAKLSEINSWVAEKYLIPFKEIKPDAKPAGGTPIMSPPTATKEQAAKWAMNKKAAGFFTELAGEFWRVAIEAGVNPVVVYCQSAKETWLGKFGGVLDESFRNTCGMKVTKGGGDYDASAHKRFDSWSDGISAQVDHLALYAGAPGYPKPDTKDPRHFNSIRGIADTVEKLGGNWAASPDYGVDVVRLMRELENTQA